MVQSPDDFNDNFDPESVRIIAAIKAGEKGVVEGLYDRHRREFLNWAKKYFKNSRNYHEDAWVDSVATFYDQALSGKFVGLTCSVSTYLFSVGENKLKKREKDEGRYAWDEDIDRKIDQPEVNNEFEDKWGEKMQKLLDAMKKLSPKCQDILTKRHFKYFSIEELATEYKVTKDRMSVDLSQCLKKLKDKLK
ncbi:MAG: RNA polymerase sigma factor [Saprospiraceae bacterium]